MNEYVQKGGVIENIVKYQSLILLKYQVLTL